MMEFCDDIYIGDYVFEYSVFWIEIVFLGVENKELVVVGVWDIWVGYIKWVDKVIVMVWVLEFICDLIIWFF